MKNIIIVVCATIAIALAGFGAYQHKRSLDLQKQLLEAQNQLAAAQEQLTERTAAEEKIAQAERKAKVLQETLAQTSEMTASQSKKVSQLEQSLASTKTNSNPFGEIFKNPEMKQMIKTQQKAVMGPMIDKNYADFFKQLNLTPEQSAYVKELLEKKMMVGAEAGIAMLDGSLDAEKRKELTKQIKADTEAVDEELKKFLGDDYKTLKDYESSMADRMATTQLRDQFASSGTPLAPDQEKQLLDLSKQTRKEFVWTTDFNNANQTGDMDLATMFNEDRLKKHFEEQTQYDKLLVQKAASVLRPEQLTAYEKFLETQRKLQEASMKIAGQMFNSQPSQQTPATGR